MSLELEHASTTELVARMPTLVLRVLRGHHTTMADVDRLERLLDAALTSTERIAYLQVIDGSTPPLQPAIRRRGADLLDRYGERVVSVIVFDSLGFWATTLRAGLSVFTSMLRRSSIRIEASVPAGIERLAAEFGSFDVDELLDDYMGLVERWGQAGHDPAGRPRP